MKLEIEIHPAQAHILAALLFAPSARFSELNATNLSSDHFSFHIKRLEQLGLIAKDKANRYSLTAMGKEFANRLDTDEKVIERQAKLGIEVVAVKPGEPMLFLAQQRLKHPYYGYYGFVTGKIRWGEMLAETAAREFKEETGLEGEFQLVGIQHKLDYSSEGDLLEDKYFYVVRATNITGELMEAFEGGRNAWMSEKEILALPKTFQGIEHPINMAKQDGILVTEFKSSYTKEEY